MPEPRILLFDIETAPSLGYYFDRYRENNIIDVVHEGFVMSFAYKWLEKTSFHVRALPDYPSYKKDKQCDRALLGDLWDLLDEADVVIAHNGDRFDLRYARARFLAHGFIPYDPSKTVDTLKIARQQFKFTCGNRLDALGAYLGVGRKLPMLMHKTWREAMGGDLAAWAVVKKYNIQDVRLLELVYEKLRPWAQNHPNLAHISGKDECPSCQSKVFRPKGWSFLKSGKRQRYLCGKCGHRFQMGPIIKL